MGALEIEDLEMIRKDRKSTKRNVDGPIIYGAKAQWGMAKQGHSIPRHLRENKDHEYGLSSYHRGAASELKQLMSNEIFREELMGKVSSELAKQVAMETRPKRKVENKTSELRKELGAQRRLKNDASMNSLGILSAANTFSQRSRSVLPPIRSDRGGANDIAKAAASP